MYFTQLVPNSAIDAAIVVGPHPCIWNTLHRDDAEGTSLTMTNISTPDVSTPDVSGPNVSGPNISTANSSMTNTTTLRLALGMRGGVSLAVWIGGAVAELDDLRRAEPSSTTFYDRLLGVGRYNAVEIDVMSGASAGGLNAVLAATAMVGGAEVGDMRETWLGVAGLRDLLESQVGNDPTRRSLLGGEFFSQHILNKVTELQAGSAAQNGQRPDHLKHRLDVFLSGTVLGGLPVNIEDDQYSSDHAKRSGALFHFRHYAADPALSDLIGDGTSALLAKAARTTASFPTAFEPMEFEPGEMPGVLLLPSRPTQTIRLLDGGVVDNIPVARALHGVPNIPSRTATDRWLMYLQPSPDAVTPVRPNAAADTAAPDIPRASPGLLGVLLGIVGAFMSESILDDVEVLRQHNLDAVETSRAWAAAVGTIPANPPAPSTADVGVDSSRLVAVLLDPDNELVWRPLHQSIPASPLAGTSAVAQDLFRTDVDNCATTATTPLRPFAAIARTSAMLTRWARVAELGLTESELTETAHTRTVISSAKLTAYQLMHLAQLLTAAGDWHVLQTAATPPEAGQVVGALQSYAAALNADVAVGELAAALPLGELDLAAQVGHPLHGALLLHLHNCTYTPVSGTTRSGITGSGNTGAGTASVAELMWQRLADQARALTVITNTAAANSDPIFADLANVIAKHPHAAADYLKWIDQRTVGIHHGLASATPRTFQYLRMAGSNLSPLCESPSRLAYEGPRFSTNSLVVAPGASSIPAHSKLAGSDLGNFSAFISQRWRANDWMWGRLDAAKSIVDLVTSTERLGNDVDAAFDSIESVMTSAFDLEAAVEAAWGDELRTAATTLWAQYRTAVRTELESEIHPATNTDPTAHGERLRITKSVLVLRRHWEILANELPVVRDAELRPGKMPRDAALATHTASLAPPPAPTASTRAPLATTLTEAVSQYEQSPRSFGQVWGTRWLTALGIRTAYAFWAATSPRSMWKRWLRVPLKPLPMTTLGIALARNRGLMAMAISFNLVLIPRLSGIAAWIVWSLGLITAVVLGQVFASSTSGGRNVPLERFGAIYRAATLALFTAGAALNGASGLRTWFYKARLIDATAPINTHVITPYTLVSFVAAALTSWLLWCWAKWYWRIASAIFVAEVTAIWTVFSRIPVPLHPSHVERVLFSFGSIGWALAIAIMLPTTVAHWAFHSGVEITEYQVD